MENVVFIKGNSRKWLFFVLLFFTLHNVFLFAQQANEPFALFMHAQNGDFKSVDIRAGDIISYKSWDDSNWSAKLASTNKFIHAPNGDFNSPNIRISDFMAYKSWDNTNWGVKIQNGVLVHALNGDFKSKKLLSGSNLIAYKFWDNTNWMATVYPRSLTKESYTVTKGINVQIELREKILSDLAIAKTIYFADKAYELYRNFVGGVPKGGPVYMKINSEFPGVAGLAYLGTNQMYLASPLVAPYITEHTIKYNDANFALLHEMAHLFDITFSSFEYEFTANLKIYYLLMNNFDLNIYFGDKKLSGDSFERESYLNYMGEYNKWGMDSFLNHKFLSIAKLIGWGHFTVAFKTMRESSGKSKAELFNIFINKLNESSKVDLWKLFDKNEIVWLEKRYGGKIGRL